ncbi:MAG: two-component system, chemotaxis family, CheB/CheR fusion protein [Verrucomicrobiota bacterium]
MSEEQPPAAILDPARSDDSSENARNGAQKRRDPDEPCAVVGLGASAGGIAVLQQFFSDMSPESGLAFVVVMHLSPEHESNLANVIKQKTSMPVMQVMEPVKVKPNHVYVIPPNHQLTFEDSTLNLVAPQQALGRRVTIDLFFRTLAQAYGQRAVAVILSGSNSDGVIGLKHVRAQGGVTIAQDPNEAEHDSMPATAISTGMVDWVLPVAEMAPKLMEFVRNENRMKLPPEDPDAKDPDAKDPEAPGGETISEVTQADDDEFALRDVLAYVRSQTGHDFSHYKRATVLRRVARRMQVNSVETIPHYRDFLRTHPVEARALLQDLLIGVTHFFRDQDSFAALEANIPQLFAGRREKDQIRVWVGGCATGEEAYSIAMLLCEHAERLEKPPSIQVFATDLDEHAIQDARAGLYPTTIEADVSLERLRRFFERDHGRYRVKKGLREKILFAAHNLLRDPPFSRIDLVSCRNLLIYLNRAAQEQVFDLFHFALKPGGLLFIGSSETGGNVQPLFSAVDAKHRLFVRRSVPRPSWRVPALPSGSETEALARAGARTLPPLMRIEVDEAWANTERSQLAGKERRAVLFGELHLKLLEEYGPPSVVVNEGHDIVHLSAKAGRYLQFIAGEPTANLLKVVDPALRSELRTSLFRASQNQETVFSAPQPVGIDGKTESVAVEVRPMRSSDPAKGFFLVLFHRQNESARAPAGPAAQESIARTLDDEVEFLKEQLNTTVEQYEASNEELKASNEELQAVNEEMRSATEELETSKEELQSVNEELTTVNHELKSSVEDFSRANTDLTNLMASTDIGTIFLDRQLRIQRFTPSAQKIFNLLPADLGRPLSDITSKLAYPGFIQEAHDVLENLATTEREVRVDEEGWFVVRIAPYRTQEDRIAGVVATFIDITRRKKAEEEMRTAELRYRTFFEMVPVAVYTTDAEGTIQEFNQRAAELWGRAPAKNTMKFCGSFKIFHSDGTFMPHEECPMARVLRGEELGPADLELIVEHQDGGRRNVMVAPRAFKDESGTIIGAINCLTDITHRKQAEEAVRESEERFRTVADNIPQLIWTNEAAGNANYFNKGWYDYSGLTYEQSAGPGWQAMVHPDDEPASVERWQRALAKGEVFDAEYRLRRHDGAYRWFIGRNVPLRADGQILSWFGTATDIDDLKQAEAALHETQERFRLLVEGAQDYAMFLLGVDNRITFWSKGAERLFGWSEGEVIGKTADLIFTPEDKEKGAAEHELATALDEGRALDRRWHLRKDGSRFWTDGIMTRLDHESGQLRGFAKIARDATDQRRAEEELRHARDQMEQRVVERTQELLATNNELEQTMAQRQQLERELLEISEREKRRIGEDLHDMVCQELSATALFLKSNAKKLANENPAVSGTLDEAAQTVNRNVGVARELARGLQAVELTASGLKNALRDLAAQASEHRGIKCLFKCARGVRVPDDTVALHLYRIAQEAVANAVKHSGAKNVLIHLDRDPTHTCVSVQDDGKGFVVRKNGKGLGLHMMRYRANALGGKLKIERRRTGGMDITCVIPTKR